MNAAGGAIYRLGPEEDLLRTLECPVCTDVPIPPIFSCENGHIVCSDCKAKLQNCALCKAKFLATRNFPLESIVNSSSFRCPNEESGCKERIQGSNYKGHVNNCDFRYVVCNHSKTRKCEDQLIPMRIFFTHLKEDHGFRTTEINDSGIAFSNSIPKILVDRYLWPIECLIHAEGIFLQRSFIKGSVYNIMVKYLGPQNDAKKYRVKIKIFSSSNKDIDVEWRVPVHSFRKTDLEITNEGLCVALPKSQLLAIAVEDSDGKLTWKVCYTIEKIN